LLAAAPPQNPPAPAIAAQAADKRNLPGLPNFGMVNETLYRGAQPADAGYAELKKQSIQIVVSFREEPRKIADERRVVEGLGMRFVSIPWSALDGPRSTQVAEFLQLLRENPGQKIFAHCLRGADRTGVMVAAYRIASEKWAPRKALDEMEIFSFHGFWLRDCKKYVLSFRKQLESDPVFRPFVSPEK
jgi:protein tyrosine/serine phosphatase